MDQVLSFMSNFGMAIAIMIILTITVVCGIKGKWWSRFILKDFDESGIPPECFMCNEGPKSCYKELECKLVKQSFDEMNCG